MANPISLSSLDTSLCLGEGFNSLNLNLQSIQDFMDIFQTLPVGYDPLSADKWALVLGANCQIEWESFCDNVANCGLTVSSAFPMREEVFIYDYTGTFPQLPVPSRAVNCEVHLWGAAGGGTATRSLNPANWLDGAAGGYTTATVPTSLLPPILGIMVGQGGSYYGPGYFTDYPFGFGGPGTIANRFSDSAGGGGSFIFDITAGPTLSHNQKSRVLFAAGGGGAAAASIVGTQSDGQPGNAPNAGTQITMLGGGVPGADGGDGGGGGYSGGNAAPFAKGGTAFIMTGATGNPVVPAATLGANGAFYSIDNRTAPGAGVTYYGSSAADAFGNTVFPGTPGVPLIYRSNPGRIVLIMRSF